MLLEGSFADWAVCHAGMAADAPLRAVQMGLQLLLARSQLWQETAAKHVSLAPQLERLNAVALRWSRMQLVAWRNTIRNLRDRHAAGTHLGSTQSTEVQQCQPAHPAQSCAMRQG